MFAYEGNVLIDGGEGYDTLQINTSGSFDLSNVSNIEVIDLATGIDLGSINLADVISLTDTNNKLIINSEDMDASNQVQIDTASGLTKSNTELAQDNRIYDVYSGTNGEELLIEVNPDILT